MTHAKRSLSLLSLLVVACGGGGGSTFSPTFPDNEEPAIRDVLARLAAAGPATADPVAAGITSAPHQLFVVDLQSGSERWKSAVGQPVSAPQVAGSLVILHEQGGVVARDVANGQERFTVEDEALYLAGASGEGEWSAFVLTTGGGVGARSKLVVARNGRIAWQRSMEQALGAPAVAGGMIFIPWATQNVSVLDVSSGEELARVRVTDTPVGRAFRRGDEVYFGQNGVFRLTPSIATGARATAAYFEPMARTLPGDPALLVDPYRPAPGPASAVHKIRLDWFPGGSGETMAFGDDTIYSTFYRFVFALDPNQDAVRFVYAHPEDIVGASAMAGGLLIADEGGGLAFVNSEGQRTWSVSVTETPTAVTFRPGSFQPRGAPQGPALSLEDQLLAAAQNRDDRLVPARRMAVHMLNQLPSEGVTARLIEICAAREEPPPVRDEACARLAERTTGASAVVAALGRHGLFLEGTTAGPIGPLALAAATMGDARAVPALLAHVVDPQTSAADLRLIFQALATLGGDATAVPLTDWLRLYHAEARDEELTLAVEAAAKTLLALEGPAAIENVEALATDPLASADVRAKLTALTNEWRAAQPPEPCEGEDCPEETEAEEEEEVVIDETFEEAPEQTTLPMLEQILRPVAAPLRACLSGDSQRASSARIILVLAGDGTVQLVSVTPDRLQSCIGPLIRRQTFPGNRRGEREQLTYTLRR